MRTSLYPLRYLTSLLRTWRPGKPHGWSIYLQFQFDKVLFVSILFHPVSILFCSLRWHPPHSLFCFCFSLPFGWECKGRKLFCYSKKKILFFFFLFSSAFHFFPFIPNRVAKVEVIFITPNFILKYFELFFIPTLSLSPLKTPKSNSSTLSPSFRSGMQK